MAKKNIKNLFNYNQYSEEVQKQMQTIINFLIEKYTVLQSEWTIALQMLANNLHIFQLCSTQIAKDGIMLLNRFGVYEKHPLLKVQNDAQIQIVKLLNEFGLTPKSLSKLQLQTEDNAEDFINSLLS